MQPQSITRPCAICGQPFHSRKNATRYCSRACIALGATRPWEERFWEKVDRSGGPDACWLWMAARFQTGYGAFTPATGKKAYSHRIAYELTHGPIPEGLFICHNCPGGDNRACCNPAHLFAGTSQDNVRDMMAKGKWHHPPFTDMHQRGERHSHAKLTDAQVAEIRRRYVPHKHKLTKTLADEFGVSKNHIRNLAQGKFRPPDTVS